jgi:hypothetical protein
MVPNRFALELHGFFDEAEILADPAGDPRSDLPRNIRHDKLRRTYFALQDLWLAPELSVVTAHAKNDDPPRMPLSCLTDMPNGAPTIGIVVVNEDEVLAAGMFHPFSAPFLSPGSGSRTPYVSHCAPVGAPND